MKRGTVWTFPAILANAALLAAFSAFGAMAQEATLTSRGGALQISGRIIGFDGEYLTIESSYGPLTLPGDQVICVGPSCPDMGSFVPEVRFSGSTGLSALLLPALFDGYARQRGWQIRQEDGDPSHQRFVFEDDGADVAIFHLRSSTASEGFADFIAFETDVVVSDREAHGDEILRAAEVGQGQLDGPRQARVLALDGLVPVVSPFLTVDRLTLADLARVFGGEVENWAALGGPDQPISLHLAGPDDGLTERFVAMVLDATSRSLSDRITWHPTRQEMLAAITEDHGALGISSFRETGLTKALSLSDRCGFIATPRLLTLKTEDYPLTAPLFLYVPDRRLPEAGRDFLSFLRKPEAQLIVRRANFVDQGAVPIPLDAQGQRFANAISAAGPEVSLDQLQEMVAVLLPRTRLSTSFRFEAGAVTLDAQSGANLLTLAQAIRDGHFAGRQLLLAGFSDGRGAAVANESLSLERAETVRRALLGLLGELPADVTVEVAGFGEALPMGCDDTLWGRQMNRRVELWVSE